MLFKVCNEETLEYIRPFLTRFTRRYGAKLYPTTISLELSSALPQKPANRQMLQKALA